MSLRHEFSLMSQFDAQDWITRLFLRLRQRGYSLGMGEYPVALKAVEAGYVESADALVEMVQIVWCHSRSQQTQLIPIWQELQIEVQKQREKQDEFKDRLGRDDLGQTSNDKPSEAKPQTLESIDQQEITVEPKSQIATLPVQAPAFTPNEREGILSLQNYFPVSRRSMVYGWRFLRRMMPDGGRTLLDVEGTIRRVTEAGFYLAPVYRQQQRNGAKLMLLIDQNGSMMPFHRFSRDMVETAREESRLQEENVRVFYFHNVPGEYVYQDVYLTKPVLMTEVLETCDGETSVLVVSDGGAARGYRRQGRIQETTRFLLKLKRRTSLIAWVNPMSRKRWRGSSAEILAYLVPMFEMSRMGFAEAIDALRGLNNVSVEESE